MAREEGFARDFKDWAARLTVHSYARAVAKPAHIK